MDWFLYDTVMKELSSECKIDQADFAGRMSFLTSNLQKQSPEVFCKKSCSYKFRKIHRKTPTLKPLF